ncbi:MULTISPECIES: trifunctional transcriptional regulator/proline dehydrogenase/L-glutamate gamma-semialdehyde dehydrogenase [unclassified Thiomonas]|jgi:RHH-type proline utilization regulon transcriptional repressor/proline dehydrogenase/delta 1-pyrroline-5-carboxylate dehydrogenase|uniref:trifunctional transcriptional regulator/proline dehydrogenase/L-glutamate gamma-semialdehyde dehydrogenase n=1 Tax=unclassified Thiomonas TaxID=2625466 RepID=UPI000BCF7FA0|nr:MULTISPECIES: trifunctional transcriptional regulator/proline dehydrogenase/L-glutamate gamma-semialdehyde dehydrogenase [unclassified Thiomonas]OZB71292.1 MAG: trifunctional transcriptional regulator/proline dehydrogenase/L-glutamate gamma-semialdehyde dehydrogenase [Thiomonas sp. 13-64-67]
MGATTTGIKMDEAMRQRVRLAADRLGRTPHWLIKQATLNMVERIERGEFSLDTLSSTEKPSQPGTPHDEPEGATFFTPFSTPFPTPFLDWAQNVLPQTDLRAAITAAWHRPEPECLPMLIELAQIPDATQRTAVRQVAERLVEGVRARREMGGVEALVQEFSLSSQEGVALMCLAEALLRIPDNATRDALIRDKISRGDWQAHLGHSPSVFVNAAVWGLMLTGRLTATASERGLASALSRLIGKGGEPLIRQGVQRAMRLMGEQFVTGQTIAEALANSRPQEKKGFRYSYDMLGEAAITEADAQRYFTAYEQALHAIGKASHGRGIFEGPGLSVKLSALHPRYTRAQYARVMDELLPRLTALVELARRYDVGINIDAEEADRLELSLDLLEALCFNPALKGWNGIGFVVQAYQKRCPFVIDYLVDLARRSGHRLMVRLVKGAYWDSEIKRAQIDGLDGYPVYTRKVHTDVSYLACARKLLAAPDAVYPQFATHNAQTLASIMQMAGENYYAGQYEFQCLHGMGEPLYDQVVGPVSAGKLARPCRIYAPVGTHDTLLAYLVRRLLENGANTSFVNRIGDDAVPVSELVTDPVDEARAIAVETGVLGAPHPRIPLPRQLFSGLGAQARLNSAGLNLANEQQLASLSAALLRSAQHKAYASPTVANQPPPADNAQAAAEGWVPVLNPADPRDQVGWVRQTTRTEVDEAVRHAQSAAPIWQVTPPGERAACLQRAADALEQQMQNLLGLIVREAGKTLPNAIGEVREAVDFLRYYAAQTAAQFDNATHRPLGVVLCISPWNFPLSIFCGQVAAALAAGNAVLAKPAEQTALIAAALVHALHAAGVPTDAVQLVPGDGGTVGAALVAHPAVAGVMFTGSTEVAQLISRTVSKRLSPQGRSIVLIAETGGQNALIADSSALAEQLVADVLTSAFDSAGQRCSALRLLCIQEDVADRVIGMIRDAMDDWILGNPDRMHTDLGPVIDAEARDNLEAHIARMQAAGLCVTRLGRDESGGLGTFVRPTLIEIDTIDRLQREVFGPVLHVLRYRREQLGAVLDAINATGYGLTFGVHSRIDETIAYLSERIHAGNVYVNRNLIGAVVGVQPFGGMSRSGTGPKAGGPLYLHRLVQPLPQANSALPVNLAAAAAECSKITPEPASLAALRDLLAALQNHTMNLDDEDTTRERAACEHYLAHSPISSVYTLPGPTGESNRYRLLPRSGGVWCIPQTVLGLVHHIAATLATGNLALIEAPSSDSPLTPFLDALPPAVKAYVRSCPPTQRDTLPELSVVLFEGDADALARLQDQLAQRDGLILRIESLRPAQLADGAMMDLTALVHEQSLSVNTAAAGGNAQLMTLG